MGQNMIERNNSAYLNLPGPSRASPGAASSESYAYGSLSNVNLSPIVLHAKVDSVRAGDNSKLKV